jgi:hypothetical protein
LWLGLDPPEPLRALKHVVDDVLAWLGPDSETANRGFSPHLTLARFATRPHQDLNRFLAEHRGFDGGRFVASSFHLYRSTLRPEGALHEIVESYPLLVPPLEDSWLVERPSVGTGYRRAPVSTFDIRSLPTHLRSRYSCPSIELV